MNYNSLQIGVVLLAYSLLGIICRAASSYDTTTDQVASVISPPSGRRQPHLLIEVFRNGESTGGRYMEITESDCRIDGDAIGKMVGFSLHYFDDVSVTFNNASIDEVYRVSNTTRIKRQCKSNKDCSVYNELGQYISNCTQLKNFDKVYVVPKNKIFVWPTHRIGHKYVLPHVKTSVNASIELETYSVIPRIFKIRNLISDDEAIQFINIALGDNTSIHRLQRSTTTAGNHAKKVVMTRTSSNSFDSNSDIAQRLKRRIFEMLGIHNYIEDMNDGFQIVHYNQTEAYSHHHDFFENILRRQENGEYFPHNFDPYNDFYGLEGSNRAATVFMYLTDVEDGGETVFPDAPPYGYFESENATLLTKAEALYETTAYIASKNLSHVFPNNSWTLGMVSDCRNRLHVKPKKLEAILFYSQSPEGILDPSSIHGGCPVISGEKWAANLWIWNSHRGQSQHQYHNNNKLEVKFINENVPGATLFWHNSSFGVIEVGNSFPMATYEGHKFNVRLSDKIVKTFTMTKDISDYIISESDIDRSVLQENQEL